MTKLRVSIILALFACSAAELLAQGGQTPPPDAVATAPVVVDGEVLFHVRGISSLPAAERAGRIRAQILAAAADPAITPESLRVVDEASLSRIMTGDRTLAGVVDADGELEQIDRMVLARAHQARIQHGITLYRENRTRAALVRGITRTAIATVLLVGVLVVLAFVRRWVNTRLVNRLLDRVKATEIPSLKLMPADRIYEAVRNALAAVRTILVVAVVLLYLGFVLAQFPWTRFMSGGMASFAIGPLQTIGQSVLDAVPGLVFLLVLYVVFRLALRLIRLFFGGVERGAVTLSSFDPEWAQPTYKIIRIALIAFALVVAYPYIPGSQTAAFQGISIFAGIVFSLGSSTAIANIIAGYMLIYRRAFKVGDLIRMGDHLGEVVGTRMQVTHLRSPKNEEIIIPNAQMLSSEVVNFSSIGRKQGLILHTEVGIGYETPWRQVEAMLIEAAQRTQDLGTEPRAFVFEKSLGDFAVVYELNVYCTNVGSMRALYAALHRNILDVFNEYGVQIMTPAYEGDPAQPKIVDPKQWFTPPAKAEA